MSGYAHNKFFIIYGPPGCGKTYRLQSVIAECITQYGRDGIFVTSFSRAAAHNIAERVGKDVLAKRQIGTLHALAFAALGNPKIAEAKADEFSAKYHGFRLSAVKTDIDNPITDQEFRGGTADDLLSEYSRLRATLRDRALWPRSVTMFARAWEEWKSETGYLDFTDLIDKCRVHYGPRPRGMEVLIVDEAQDLTPNQHLLIQEWGSLCKKVVIAGDDDQTIFSHTGATAEDLIDPDIADDHREILPQSYRVPRTVQAVAEAWIARVKNRVTKTYRPRDVDGMVRTSPATWQRPHRALDDAQAMIATGRSVLFLTSCAYMLKPLIETLRERGLPFHNPLRTTRGDWNPLGGGRGVATADRLLAYLRPHGDVWGEEARMWTITDIDCFVDLLAVTGVLRRGAKSDIEARAERIAKSRDDWAQGRISESLPDPELSMSDLLTYFHAEALDHLIEMDLDWFKAHVTKAKQGALDFPLAVIRHSGAAALRETPALTLGTIHSYKGGQADCVYLFPDISMAADENWQSIGPDRDAIVRQFYVGISRAAEQLIVCNPSGACRVVLPLAAAKKVQVAA